MTNIAEDIMEARQLNELRVVELILRQVESQIKKYFTPSMVNVKDVYDLIRTILEHFTRAEIPVPVMSVEKYKGGVKVLWRWREQHKGFRMIYRDTAKRDQQKVRVVPAEEIAKHPTHSLLARDYILKCEVELELNENRAVAHIWTALRWAARQACKRRNCGTACKCGPCAARLALEYYGLEEKR